MLVYAYAEFSAVDVIAKVDLKDGDYFASKSLGAKWHIVPVPKALADWARCDKADFSP